MKLKESKKFTQGHSAGEGQSGLDLSRVPEQSSAWTDPSDKAYYFPYSLSGIKPPEGKTVYVY